MSKRARKSSRPLRYSEAQVITVTNRILRFAHAYGDLRECLALIGGYCSLRGDLLVGAIQPMIRELGGIEVELIAASQHHSPMLQRTVKNTASPIVSAYLDAMNIVVESHDGDPLRELIEQRDYHIRQLSQLRESVRPGPKTPVTTQKIREAAVILTLSKTHAGQSQEAAILALHDELAAKPYPDALEAAILGKLNTSADPVRLVQKWLQRTYKQKRQIDLSAKIALP